MHQASVPLLWNITHAYALRCLLKNIVVADPQLQSSPGWLHWLFDQAAVAMPMQSS